MNRQMQDLANHPLRAADQYSEIPQGRSIIMVKPDYFDVVAAINPHMRDAQGSLNQIDKVRARHQWQALADAYRQIGMNLTVFDARPDCPDMVFCANQSFPFLALDGTPRALLSNMRDDTRHCEVEAIGAQLESRGVRLHMLPARSKETHFEGMGDALWVPGRRLICGGFGFRTDSGIYRQLRDVVDVPIVLFDLRHPKFYHLDTCLSLLDSRTALACREGFTAEGWAQLEVLFPRLIEVPLAEADAPGFACNAHCPDQQHVLLQRGSEVTCAALRENGFTPIELDSSEFIKSGGSIFCMKLQCPWDSWPYEALA